MKFPGLFLCGSLMLASAPLYALTLADARIQGLVGETLNGYLAPVSQNNEVLTLVNDINAARLQHYQQIAEKNGLKIDDVAQLSGQKLVERAKPGEYVRGINGQWLRK